MPEFLDNIKPGGQPDPPKRPQHPPEYLSGVYACGQRREHLIRIHRSNWPPKQIASLNDRPYVTGTCERCGGTCLVYDPVPSDMTVTLYGAKGEEAGQVIDEAGAVVQEGDLSGVGQLVDEPENVKPPKRR